MTARQGSEAINSGNSPDYLTALGRFVDGFPVLVTMARDARRRAQSYRGFRVGVAAVALQSQNGQIDIFTGENTKPNATKFKVCAETRAIRQAHRKGFDTVVGLVVTGPPQPDGGSNRVSPTLHCCEDCRHHNFPKLRPDTLVATVHPDQNRFQLMTVDELGQLHANPTLPEPPLFNDPAFKSWDENHSLYSELVLRPVHGRPVSLDITPVEAARAAITGMIRVAR